MGTVSHINGISALELTMRDVLDGLEDFASDFAFDAMAPGVFEILAIEQAEEDLEEQPIPLIPEPAIWCAPVIALIA